MDIKLAYAIAKIESRQTETTKGKVKWKWSSSGNPKFIFVASVNQGDGNVR
jgi:hypothetical protein